MGKKTKGASVNLDSFLDIMCCLVGVLVFIILLTGIDAAQIKVLIPTPMERDDLSKTPVFIECRNNQLYKVDYKELLGMAEKALEEIAVEAKGDTAEMLRLLSTRKLESKQYSFDLTYALLGQVALMPLPDGPAGYSLKVASDEKAGDWFGRILGALDLENEMLTFIVRDDSFAVFKKARAVAWTQKADVSYELLDVGDPLKFGLGGSQSFAQ